MTLTREEQNQLTGMLRKYDRDEKVQEMKRYIQHGSVSTYQHCRNVTWCSYWMNRRWRLGADEQTLIAGAFLHDFYLYDWHEKDASHRFHGFTHPERACLNASKHFSLNPKVRNIIISHMWPLTLTRLPASREAVIVCIADKYCSLVETLFQRKHCKPI